VGGVAALATIPLGTGVAAVAEVAALVVVVAVATLGPAVASVRGAAPAT
jgi:hypothetical protein